MNAKKEIFQLLPIGHCAQSPKRKYIYFDYLYSVLLFIFVNRCDVSAAPSPPPATFLLPNITAGIAILETDQLYYKCLADPGKTYLEGQPNNQFPVTCLPGAVWQIPADSEWPICQDTTTTTEPPTTTVPSMSKDLLSASKTILCI